MTGSKALTSADDDDLDEVPAPLDPTAYRRPPSPPGLREIDGIPVRVFAPGDLPKPTLRDRLPFLLSGLGPSDRTDKS